MSASKNAALAALYVAALLGMLAVLIALALPDESLSLTVLVTAVSVSLVSSYLVFATRPRE